MIAVAASVACALLFAGAGIDKVRHRALLPGVIANYRLLHPALVAPAALALPVVELAVAVGLALGVAPVAPLAAAALLLVFAGAMAVNIRRGRHHIDCGCGHSGLRQRLGWGQVARNLLLALALVPAIIGQAPLIGSDALLAAAAGVVLYLLLLLFTALRGLPGEPARPAAWLRPERG
jgi:hypothetical protein